MLNHTLFIERARAIARPFLLTLLGASAAVATVGAQAPSRGGLSGRLTDTLGAPIPGAVVHLVGTSYGATSDGGGRYRVEPVAQGSYRVSVRRLGFASDTFSVTVGGTVVAIPDRVLRSAAAVLAGVVIRESGRLNETREAALARRDQADNLIVVQSGDEIRSLPNANAAEALARMPAFRQSATRVKESLCKSAARNRGFQT